MPLYTYVCQDGHEIEALRSIDTVVAACFCGHEAQRQAANRVSVIGKADVPREQRNYRQSYGEYREALADVAYENEEHRKNGEQVSEPDYYEVAKAKAASKGAKIR